MDPSEVACRIYNTFTESRPTYDLRLLPEPYGVEVSTPLSLNVNVAPLREVDHLVPLYCDVDKYNALQNLKASFDDELPGMSFEEARASSDPFVNIGTSIFMDRDGVVMANMDAIFKFTGHYASLLKQRLDHTYEKVGTTHSKIYETPVGLFKEDSRFTFCDIADERGAFTQYIQYRIKKTQGYGMTPTEWNLNQLNTRYFTITYGEDGTGSLFSNWESFIALVRGRLPLGVHLAMATGDLDPDSRSEQEKEYLNTRLVLEETLLGISCCGENGSFVLKIFDTVTRFSAELLYVLVQCFEIFLPFKPISSAIETSERYLVCLRRRSDDVVDVYKNLLTEVHHHYQGVDLSESTLYVTQFLKEPLPETFVAWLTKHNNLSIDRQTESARTILDFMAGIEVDIPRYNLPKTLKIWSIPGNVPKEIDLSTI